MLWFVRGDYVKVQELVDPHKGKWFKIYKVLEQPDHSKLYSAKEL